MVKLELVLVTAAQMETDTRSLRAARERSAALMIVRARSDLISHAGGFCETDWQYYCTNLSGIGLSCLFLCFLTHVSHVVALRLRGCFCAVVR